MKLSIKLSLAMASLAFIIAFSNVFSIWQLSRVNSMSTALATNWMPSIVAIEEMNTLLSDYRVQEIQYVNADTQEEQRSYEERMDVTSKSFAERKADYERIPMSAEGKKIYDEFGRLHLQYQEAHDQMIALKEQNKKEEAVAVLNGPSREVYFDMSELALRLVERNVKGGTDASLAGDVIYREGAMSLMGLLVGGLLISVVVLVIIVRGTLKQLGKDPGILGHIAQRVTDGDYNIDDGSPRIGVYGNIVAMVEALKLNIDNATAASEQAAQESARAMEAMQSAEAASAEAKNKTQTMLVAADKLEQVANVVSSASTQLSAQIEQSERGATQQASQVAETAAAMNEMNSTVMEVARNASDAFDASTQTRNKASEGSQVVGEAVSGIQGVQTSSLALKEDMQALADQAQSISQIMEVISDIADQTNLLALNAAIEAARAGEAGRGFAVVADEVRNLAEKTMASTTDVGNAIKAIQQSAAKSMQAVDATVTNIENATSLANRSGEALQEIVGMVDTSADQVRAIATASEQQSASSEEINRSILHVNTIATETARAMQEAAQAVSELAEQAQVLTSLIEDMKRG